MSRIDPLRSSFLCANGGPIKCRVCCDKCRSIYKRLETLTKQNMVTYTEIYKELRITIEEDGAGTGNKYFTWVIDYPEPAGNLDISDQEFPAKELALQDAKEYIDQWYSGWSDKAK